jgi:hypothetical protein
MNRYNVAKVIHTPENPSRRFTNIKYPTILTSPSDIYVYTTQGDRYDILALNYYNDSSLWWVINRANPNQPSDSLYPIIGTQLRIPSANRILSIISTYEDLNELI